MKMKKEVMVNLSLHLIIYAAGEAKPKVIIYVSANYTHLRIYNCLSCYWCCLFVICARMWYFGYLVFLDDYPPHSIYTLMALQAERSSCKVTSLLMPFACLPV